MKANDPASLKRNSYTSMWATSFFKSIPFRHISREKQTFEHFKWKFYIRMPILCHRIYEKSLLHLLTLRAVSFWLEKFTFQKNNVKFYRCLLTLLQTVRRTKINDRQITRASKEELTRIEHIWPGFSNHILSPLIQDFPNLWNIYTGPRTAIQTFALFKFVWLN